MKGKLFMWIAFGFFAGFLCKSELDKIGQQRKYTEYVVWDLTGESRGIVEDWRSKYDKLSFTEIPLHRVQGIKGGGYMVNMGELLKDLNDE